MTDRFGASSRVMARVDPVRRLRKVTRRPAVELQHIVVTPADHQHLRFGRKLLIHQFRDPSDEIYIRLFLPRLRRRLRNAGRSVNLPESRNSKNALTHQSPNALRAQTLKHTSPRRSSDLPRFSTVLEYAAHEFRGMIDVRIGPHTVAIRMSALADFHAFVFHDITVRLMHEIPYS